MLPSFCRSHRIPCSSGSTIGSVTISPASGVGVLPSAAAPMIPIANPIAQPNPSMAQNPFITRPPCTEANPQKPAALSQINLRGWSISWRWAEESPGEPKTGPPGLELPCENCDSLIDVQREIIVILVHIDGPWVLVQRASLDSLPAHLRRLQRLHVAVAKAKTGSAVMAERRYVIRIVSFELEPAHAVVGSHFFDQQDLVTRSLHSGGSAYIGLIGRIDSTHLHVPRIAEIPIIPRDAA